MSSNKFEVLKSRVMNVGEGSGRKIRKDRKIILREEKLKEKKRPVEVRKIEGGKILREVIVKIGLKQQKNEEGIVVETLLNSSMIGLMMSLEFARKNKFKKKKLDRPIYVRNVDSTFNYKEPIEHTVEVELFFKEHKERMEIDVINGQKWSVILGMLWLACHNSEIDWKTGEVKMTRCPDECGKQWKMKQTKPE